MLKSGDELTRGRLLAANVLVSFAGSVLPALAALAAIPILVRLMGAERFGLLSLAWTLVGAFSMFDLGIGRALTQALSERVGLADQRESPQLTWTALWLLAALGLALGAALWAAAPGLVGRHLHLTPGLVGEAIASARLIACAVPPLLVTSGLRGLLEAGQEFRVTNTLRAVTSLVSFLGPCAVQGGSRPLLASVAVLLGARLLGCGLHAAAAAARYPAVRRPRVPDAASAYRVWRVAGWMTLSTLVAPILSAADRFLIGAVLPIAAVAHYATVSELTSKLALFGATLQGVLFPALAVTLVDNRRRAAELYDRGYRVTVLAVVPVVVALVSFAPEVVRVWLGPSFVAEAAPVLRVLAVATFVNTCAGMSLNALQSAGRADVPAKFHALEVPLSLAVLWLLLTRFGLIGAAYAALVQNAFDTFALLAATPLVLPEGRAVLRRAATIAAVGAAWLGVCSLASPLPVRAATGALGFVLLGLAARRWLVTPEEWHLGRGWVAARRPPVGAPRAQRRAA